MDPMDPAVVSIGKYVGYDLQQGLIVVYEELPQDGVHVFVTRLIVITSREG